MGQIIRLYVDHDTTPGQTVPLSADQAHYLFGVMRKKAGDEILIFNGRDSEFRASVIQAGKRKGILLVGEPTKPFLRPPDLWLLFAPIKKARTDFIVEKATEMGAARILPVQTDYTNMDRIKFEKLKAHVVEAAEQCGGTFVPEVCELQKLDKVLTDWDPARKIMFCDESLVAEQAPLSVEQSNDPWAILIGPEGGFSPAERERIAGMACSHPVSLGPRILRADTAAVASLALWQAKFGDWK